MQMPETKEIGSRLGFHYLPDTLHFGIHDAHVWASGLREMGASWILLHAPVERAIPETFLAPLIKAGINPVLQFTIPNEPFATKPGDGLQVLLNHYARLGIKYVIFFDRPNLQKNWPAYVWAQEDLVERFLDQFLPLADIALYEDLKPVFPRLEPGGDYWDLAFLRASLKNMQRRGYRRLLDSMALAVSAQAGNRPLDWGAGGIDRWPGVRPYLNQTGVQDHRGFRTFDWYLDICFQELGRSMPVFLLEAGSRIGDEQDKNYAAVDQQAQVQRNLSIIHWLHNENESSEFSGKSPGEIVACFFDLKKEPQRSGETSLFKGEQPFTYEVRRWAANLRGDLLPPLENKVTEKTSSEKKIKKGWSHPVYKSDPVEILLGKKVLHGIPESDVSDLGANGNRKQTGPEPSAPNSKDENIPNDEPEEIERPQISHYVLLPLYAWGAAEWDLELIAPLLQEGHPTVGFSLTEASMADRVTIVGGSEVFTDQSLETLTRAGCLVERMLSDGTLVATV